MGGIIIIVALIIPVLLLGRLRNIYLILMVITTIWLGFLGGMDDFIKIFRHNKMDLRGNINCWAIYYRTYCGFSIMDIA